jgi:hypothetical protein
MGWKNFFTLAACRLEDFFWLRKVSPAHAPLARILSVKHKKIGNFLRVFLMNPNFLLAHRNRYFERMDDGKITPCGYPTFNSYIKNLRFSILGRDRRRDGDINPGGVG